MIKFDVRTDIDPNFLSKACTKAEIILTSQVMKDTMEFLPADHDMVLTRTTRQIGNHIVYSGVHARYLYYGKVMVDSVTGKGPAKIPDVGYRFRKGAKLVPTNRDLNMSKAVHPKATAGWIQASITQNEEKWKRVAERAISQYGK